MYIEVLHDELGRIMACYCSDTLPVEPGAPILSFTGVPQGLRHARLNIDTLTAIEIEDGSRPRAVIDPSTGQPRIEEVDRARFVIDNYEVDCSQTSGAPQGALSFVSIKRKA